MKDPVPSDFPVCQACDCLISSRCLHSIYYSEILKREKYMFIVNPTRCTNDEQCPYFKDDVTTRFARGFTLMQKQMYPHQYNTFKSILIKHFNRNSFYVRRRGELKLTPHEQEIVIAAAKRAGFKKEFHFDSYEEKIDWDN